MAKINTAVFVKEVTVTDPDSGGEVAIAIYKHENSGGMFGVDSSFIEQMFEDDEVAMIADPFNANSFVELHEVV
jgi:hypothetical protein